MNPQPAMTDMSTYHLPRLVAHADWSRGQVKRWIGLAILGEDGRYHARMPTPVRDGRALLSELRKTAGEGQGILTGFDFPIGLPLRYAEKAGIEDFLTVLPQLGAGEWIDFYKVAETAQQISLKRPFYPARPGNAQQSHLLAGLGMASIDDLRRECERSHPGRRAAAPLFWTLGGQQVGKAAITGWQEVLVPALKSADTRGNGNTTIWPFCGAFDALLETGKTIVAETYPAEFYAHLGVKFAPGRRTRSQKRLSGKRSQEDRRLNAPALLGWAGQAGVILEAQLEAAIQHGFGAHPNGEDVFDALVGLFGMLNVVLGRRSPGELEDERRRHIEGWILGQMP